MKSLPTRHDLGFWACLILTNVTAVGGDSTLDTVMSVFWLLFAMVYAFIGRNTRITIHSPEDR